MKQLADVIRDPELPEKFKPDLHQLYMAMNAATMPSLSQCRSAFSRLKTTCARAEEIQANTRQLMQTLERGEAVDAQAVQTYLRKVDEYVSHDALPDLRSRLA